MVRSRKHLVVNTFNSEVARFKKVSECPGGLLWWHPGPSRILLESAEAFRYLGVMKAQNMAKLAEHKLSPFIAGCSRIERFAHDKRITN